MIIPGIFSTFHDYFKDFATADTEVQYFMYGGVEKGYENAANDPAIAYPFLWLEEPDNELKFNGGSQWLSHYNCGISCTTTADETDKASVIAALDLTQGILFRLQKKMIADQRAYNFINMDMGFRLAEVDPGWAQNHRGWRMEFNITLDATMAIYNA
jgi:hypothetical protein